MMSNEDGTPISSGEKRSSAMTLRMILSLFCRDRGVAAAGAEVFSECDDVIFVIKLFGVAEFFYADVVGAAELADAFGGA